MPTVATRPLPGTIPDPLYPSWDGKPMGESDLHATAVILLREALEDFYAGQERVHVASNLGMYYEQGVPASRRDPDVLVALEVGNHPRISFRTWEEGKVPDVVFEVASENTWPEDVGDKREVYERIGIREYFLFDPNARFLDPVLQGYRRGGRGFVPVEPAADGSLESQVIGVRLLPAGATLRVIVAQTGSLIPTRRERIDEMGHELDEAEQRAQAATGRAQTATGRAEKAEQRAEKAEQSAEAATGRAEKAEQRADKAEGELLDLQAEIARLRQLLGQGEPPAE